MLCRDLMTSSVFTCGPTDPVSECARLMLAHDVGFLPVADSDGRLCGVVTDRDLVIRVLAVRRPADTLIRDVMTLRVLHCDPDEDIRVAEARMEIAHVSRLPIVTGGRCIGVISMADLVRVEEPRRASQLMREVASRESRPPPSFG